MKIPYRTRCAIKRGATVLLGILAIAFVVWLCWMLWLNRYVIYTRDEGAKLDFSQSAQLPEGEVAAPPEQETVSIYYNEGDNAINTNRELTQLNGYYIDVPALQEGIDTVITQLQALPKETPVLVDVKSIYGNFFYSSKVSDKRSSTINTEDMDKLLDYLKKSGMYLIAGVPALRDYEYGLHHVPDGLPTSGGYLWMDDDSCYWLNPSSEGTIAYLVQIVNELKEKGFHEVLFTDFYFPETDSIVFKGDKTQALSAAASTLVKTCSSDSFCVSFLWEMDFATPEGRCRLYKKGVAASELESVALGSGLADPAIQLVFLTEIHDTRYDAYSVLRPLAAAH